MGTDVREASGGRWYDNTRVIWALFALVGFLVGYIMTDQARAIANHDQRIQDVEKKAAVSEATLKAIHDDVKYIKDILKKP